MTQIENLEYAALILEQQDPEGTLPNTLRQIATCLAATETLAKAAEKVIAQFEGVTEWPTVGIEVTIKGLHAALHAYHEA